MIGNAAGAHEFLEAFGGDAAVARARDGVALEAAAVDPLDDGAFGDRQSRATSPVV